MNKEYKPLGVAVFLVVGGLIFSLLFLPKNGGVEKKGLSSVPFISRAHGAEIYTSATLTAQSAPFLASANAGANNTPSALQNEDNVYNEGALSDLVNSPSRFTTAPQKTTATIKVPAAGMIYQTVDGDTLQSIAAMFGRSEAKIKASNQSVNFSALTPGTPVVIVGSGM